MAPILSCRLKEYILWPCRGRLLLLVVLLYHLPSTFSQLDHPGYSGIHFVTQPQDVYTTSSLNIAYFQCKAEGDLIPSGKQLLDVRFLRDNVSLSSKFNPAPRHAYELQGNGDYVVGVVIDPIDPSTDNGRLYKCQVRINGVYIDLFSNTAELIVGDGRPPSIPLTESSDGLYNIAVTWTDVMLPSNGPILQYKAIAYDTTDNLLYTRTINNGSVFQYTFTDLNPVTTYKLSIIGINSYGEGTEENALLQAITQAPIVTGPPSGLSVHTNPGEGNIIVSVQPPLSFNNDTMTPITAYTLQYYITSDSVTSKTMPANLPYFYLYDLTVGTSYTFKITAVNSAGSSQPFVSQHVIVSYTGTATLVLTTSFTTSNTLQTISTETTTNTPIISTSSVQTVVGTGTPSTSSSSTLSTSSSSTLSTSSSSTLSTTSSSTTSPSTTSSSTSSSSTSISSITSTNIESTSTATVSTESSSSSPSETMVTTSTILTADTMKTTSTIVITSTGVTTNTSTSNSASPSSSKVTQSITRPTSNTRSTATVTARITLSTTQPPITDDQSNSGNNNLPVNLVVIAIGIVAFIILIAIIFVSILLIVFCIRSRKENTDFTDFVPPSNWPHTKPSSEIKKTWGSRDSSIKGSPLSGSINHSISDDIELPIEGLYLQVPSESPPSIRGDTQIEYNNDVTKVSPV